MAFGVGEFGKVGAVCRVIGDGREIWLGSSRTICAGVTMVRFSAASVVRVCASCELRVAVVLARVSGGEKLLRRGKFRFELRAFATVRAPSLHDGNTKDGRDDQGNESKPKV